MVQGDLMKSESLKHKKAIQAKVVEGYKTVGVWEGLNDLAFQCSPVGRLERINFGILPDFWKIEGNVFVWGEVIWKSHFYYSLRKKEALYLLKDWLDGLKLNGAWIKDRFIVTNILLNTETEFYPYDFSSEIWEYKSNPTYHHHTEHRI